LRCLKRYIAREVFNAYLDRPSFDSRSITSSALSACTLRRVDDAGFWALIDKFDWTRLGDDEAVCEPVVAALAELRLRRSIPSS